MTSEEQERGSHSVIDDLIKKILTFRDERNWKQFHNPKDVALSLVLEATEVLEHFQWKGPADVEKYVQEHKSEIADELADVLYWVLLMSHDLRIDMVEALSVKIRKNELKYPVASPQRNTSGRENVLE